jgi:hypothetical protein
MLSRLGMRKPPGRRATILTGPEQAEVVTVGVAETSFPPQPGHVLGRLLERDSRLDQSMTQMVEIVRLEIDGDLLL